MLKPKIIKEHITNNYNKIFKDISQKRIFWGLVFCIILMFIVGTSTMPDQVNAEVGQPSPMDFDAPMSINFESQILTSIKKQEAADSVDPVYRTDEIVVQELQERMNSYFSIIRNVRNYADNEEIDKAEELRSQLGLDLASGMYDYLLTMSEEHFERIHNEAIQVVERHMFQGALPADIEDVANANLTKQSILDAIALLNIYDSSRSFLSAFIGSIEFIDYIVYDAVTTDELREIEMEKVEPVMIHLARNQRIVGQGVIITEEHREALEAVGFLTTGNPAIPILGIVLLVLIGFGLVIMYLYQYRPSILQKESRIILLGLLIVSILLISNTVTAINIASEYSGLIAYAVPVAAGAMLIAILFDGKLSMFITTIIAILIGIMNNLELQFALVAFAGGFAGIYSVSKLSQRSDLVKASIYIIGANVTTILALGLILNYSLSMLSVALLLGVISGILSSVLTIGTLPFWEAVFRVTTSLKLLELSNPNQPLLKRLLLEAPGTYHHSIVVGNMAEAAADAVGADALLARVGALYHDVGKVKRAYFFIENQFANENPHDKLAPSLSTLIITSHIKDGIELAKEHGLPDNIIDIISQHHGNSLVSFFYHKANEGSSGDVLQEDDFRYDSPKTKTKEAAIVMLADAIEAGVRSIQKPTPNKIEAFARKIIKEKLEDGQLEECDLTFKELDTITHSFVKILTGIFHSRIEYPEPENVLQEMERGKADGDNGGICKQSAG